MIVGQRNVTACVARVICSQVHRRLRSRTLASSFSDCTLIAPPSSSNRDATAPRASSSKV